MLVAAAAMAFTSCQKEEVSAPETVSVNLTMHAGVEETKTYLGEENQVLWGKGESVNLYVGVNSTSTFVSSTSTDAFDGAETADFTFALDGVSAEGPYSLGGVYPASAAMADNDNPVKFKTILPQIQNAKVGKYDPSAYIMVLKPETVETLPEQYQASFRRATALNKITLTNVKEDITTVEITIPETMALAGRRYFDLTKGTSGDIYYGKSNTITVNSNFTGNTIDVWFCSWGVELEPGQELTIRMKNADKAFTRTIQANEKGIKFIEGALNTLKVNMASATEEIFNSFAGEWLITGTSESTVYAAGAWVSGKNNLNNNVQITISDNVIELVEGLENCKMLFTAITDGDYKGMYTIQDANGKYLYAASSSANQLKAGDSADNANYYWTVECNDGKYSVVASKSSNRNVMQFNPNNGSPIFSCYATASQTAVVLYPYSMVKVDTTPKVKLEKTSLELSAEASEGTINVTATNIESIEVRAKVEEGAQDESDWLFADYDEDNSCITYSAEANESEEARTAFIEVYCLDADGNEVVAGVNVIQVGVASEPVGPQVVTVAEFLNKEVSTEVWYELTGTISNIQNTQYGNFDLTDASGTIYVYGLKENENAGKTTFSNLGLKEGDVVTLIGNRAEYSNDPQVGNAYYVSHLTSAVAPMITVADNMVSISAASSATIYYTVDGSVPTANSIKYVSPFAIEEDTEVKAIAVEVNKPVSAVSSQMCLYEDPNAGKVETVEATLSFADKAQRTTFTTSQQVWTQNGITLTNDKAASTSNVADYANPARFYKSSKITVEAPGNITKIEFTCNSASYATALKSSIASGTGTATASGSVVTVIPSSSSAAFEIASLTGGQVRMNSLKVTYEK